MKDFLDEVIEERLASDSEFAEQWPAADLRIQLITLRKESKLTQGEVANKMNISQPRVAEIERHPERVSLGRVLQYLQAVGGTLSVEPLHSPGEIPRVRRVA